MFEMNFDLILVPIELDVEAQLSLRRDSFIRVGVVGRIPVALRRVHLHADAVRVFVRARRCTRWGPIGR